MKSLLLLTASLAFLVPLPSFSDVIHIPADQPTIQAGIDAAAAGDTVLVADGTYTGDGNRDIDFLGKAITVISENGPESCVIDCEELTGHRGFHFHSGEGYDSVLEGFTIRGGRIADSTASGGGVLCWGASPVIRGNIITGNMAGGGSFSRGGGGIACLASAARILDNVLESNSGSPKGGAIFCDQCPGITISGNTFESNTAPGGYGYGIYASECELDLSENLLSGHPGVAMELYLCDGTCSSNGVSDNTLGLYAYECSMPITGNRISGHPSGGLAVALVSSEIAGNTIRDNGEYGLYCMSGAPVVHDNTISGNVGGGIVVHYGGSATITGNRITGNTAQYNGGGIRCYQGTSAYLEDNLVSGNTASNNGGGIWCSGLVELSVGKGNVISGNTAGAAGGGMHLASCEDLEIDSCTVTGNLALNGGGMNILGADIVPLTNVLIAGNRAVTNGGGMHTTTDGALEFRNCTITGNEALTGSGIYCPASFTVVNSIVRDNTGTDFFGIPTVSYSDIGGEWPGEGNIDADPLFVGGPMGDFYLSQTAAGQSEDSPCVDAGDPAGPPLEGTTRTDGEADEGLPDMGFHYPSASDAPFRLVTGPGPAPANPPLVRLHSPWQDSEVCDEFSAYGPPHFGVNVTTGDLNGDAIDDIVTGAGPGEIYGPHVRGFGAGGEQLPGLNYLAYGTSKYGVNVAAGDLDADGFDEIITGAGPGAVFGPHVRGWNYDNSGTVTAMAGVNYFAYGTPKWGVNVTAGDIDGDGYDEIVTGAGPGTVYGPHVRGWNYDDTAIVAIPAVSFMAYGTNQFGVNVTCGDVDGDGIDEMVTAPGPGPMFGAHIRGWDYDGTAVSPMPDLNFFAWEYPAVSYGANVFAGADLDGDGRDDLVVGGGPDPGIGAQVRVFRYDGLQTSFRFSLEAYEGLTHGANVAAGKF